MPKKITAWECDHGCGKYLKTKKSVVNHERSCFWNPERRACASCGHNSKEYETVYNPNHGGDPGSTDREESFYWCSELEISLDEPKSLKFNCESWQKKVTKHD